MLKLQCVLTTVRLNVALFCCFLCVCSCRGCVCVCVCFCRLDQVRSEMAAKRALMVYRLNKAAFDYVIGEIHAKFMTSKVRNEGQTQINLWRGSPSRYCCQPQHDMKEIQQLLPKKQLNRDLCSRRLNSSSSCWIVREGAGTAKSRVFCQAAVVGNFPFLFWAIGLGQLAQAGRCLVQTKAVCLKAAGTSCGARGSARAFVLFTPCKALLFSNSPCRNEDGPTIIHVNCPDHATSRGRHTHH